MFKRLITAPILAVFKRIQTIAYSVFATFASTCVHSVETCRNTPKSCVHHSEITVEHICSSSLAAPVHPLSISYRKGRFAVDIYTAPNVFAFKNSCATYVTPSILNPTRTRPTPSHSASMTIICVFVKSIVIPESPVQSSGSTFQED